MSDHPWSLPLRLADLVRAPKHMSLRPDEATRTRIAQALDLVDLGEFEAEVDLAPWLDGVEIKGRWRARYVQTCGITLDPFEARDQADLLIRCVPPGSDAAPDDDAVIDPEADDPPDVVEDETVDLGAYLVEQFALSLDPFPRKPDAVFEQPPEPVSLSPFAALARLKTQE